MLNLYGEEGHSNDCGEINLTFCSGESSWIPMLSLYGEDGHSNDCGGINLTLYPRGKFSDTDIKTLPW